MGIVVSWIHALRSSHDPIRDHARGVQARTEPDDDDVPTSEARDSMPSAGAATGKDDDDAENSRHGYAHDVPASVDRPQLRLRTSSSSSSSTSSASASSSSNASASAASASSSGEGLVVASDAPTASAGPASELPNTAERGAFPSPVTSNASSGPTYAQARPPPLASPLPSAIEHGHLVSGPLTPPLSAAHPASPTTPSAASFGVGPAGLRIDVAAANANDPFGGTGGTGREIEMVDATYIPPGSIPPPDADEMCFDDEGLSALEKVYLYARSSAPFHRIFIARSLPSFLPDIAPQEAIEYVIPLMNGLAVDEDEAVKEALVEDLISSMWWFLTHCRVVDHEVAEYESEAAEPSLLPVSAFTPLLGTLLLNSSSTVGAPARLCVVNLLARIREADAQAQDGVDMGYFGPTERKFFQREVVQQVVIGMAHLEVGRGKEAAGQPLVDSALDADTSLSSSAEGLTRSSPPPSTADYEAMIPTLTSAASSLTTAAFVAEPALPSPESAAAAAAAAAMQRPPSPLPTVMRAVSPLRGAHAEQSRTPMLLSEIEPEFAHIVLHQHSDEMMLDLPAPVARAPVPGQEFAPAAEVVHRQDVLSPKPQLAPGYQSAVDAQEAQAQAQLGGDGGDLSFSDFNEEQAAVGRLASMSLTAAVTASGPLDLEYQLAFVEEVNRAGHDPVYWVRREATFALGALAKMVPEEVLYMTLLPLFETFCDDPMWNVRQSVLYALPGFLSRLPSDQKRHLAQRTILKLSADSAPQVRTGVLEVLGEVIYCFHGDDRGPPDEIIRLFIGEEGKDWYAPGSPAIETHNQEQNALERRQNSLLRFPNASTEDAFPFRSVTSSSSSTSSPIESDPARPLVCAFNLPAVALTLGPARWPELRGLYLYLVRTGTSKVRHTLAASIGEVARVIGPEHARRDLLYRWWDFARGHDAMARLKALEALEALLAAVAEPERARLVGSLEDVWDTNLRRWRERELLAKRLARLAQYFPKDGQVLRALLRRALRDDTAAVRNAAVEIFPELYDQVSQTPRLLPLVMQEVMSLAYDESFKKRITYVECQKALVVCHLSTDYRIMDDDFWQAATALASDRIVDVRIATARLVSIACDKLLTQSSSLAPGVLDIVRTLSDDPVGDVRAFVSYILSEGCAYPLSPGADEKAAPATPTTAIFSRPPQRRSTSDVYAEASQPQRQERSFPTASVGG